LKKLLQEKGLKIERDSKGPDQVDRRKLA